MVIRLFNHGSTKARRACTAKAEEVLHRDSRNAQNGSYRGLNIAVKYSATLEIFKNVKIESLDIAVKFSAAL